VGEPLKRNVMSHLLTLGAMRRNLALWILALALTASTAHPQRQIDFNTSSLDQKSRLAYQKLFTVQVFRLGSVGYGGVIADEEISLRTLLKEKKAVEVLESLVNGASPEGKLYGLLGLRFKNNAAYRRALFRLKASNGPPERSSIFGIKDISKVTDGKVPEVGRVPQGEVVTESGDLMERKGWQEALGVIDAGRYDKFLRRR